MPYVPLPGFLFRAPLLPIRALRDARRALVADPLGAAAVQLGSPSLAATLARGPSGRGGGREARTTAAANEALGRYARRAAFRPTPHALWAGVGIGRLAGRTHIRTGVPVARLGIAWTRLAALGRALLERADVREAVCLRTAPSLLVGARGLLWLAPPAGPEDGDPGFATEQAAERDDALDELVSACEAWTAWPAVRAAGGDADGGGRDGHRDGGDDPTDAESVDEWLLTLVDAGLLHTDLVPPLVGPEPDAWMVARLGQIAAARDEAGELEVAVRAARRGDLASATSALGRLPGRLSGGAAATSAPQGGLAGGLRGTLMFPTSSPFTLSRAIVDRAAALAPLLFALQEALVPPGAERTPGPRLEGALEATTETFGAGALALGALALGDYGSAPAGDDHDEDLAPSIFPRAPVSATGAPLVTFLVERIVEAARQRRPELALAAHELAPLAGDVALPPTCELFMTPTSPRSGGRPGDGWLLGLHAPAGATWGRFAAALGDEGRALLDALAAAERAARPGERALDVVFAPSPRLADLCTHPPLREGALAISGWPDPAAGRPEVTPADLELVADPSALEPLALRAGALGPVAPSPLHRVRSHTAPPGLWRLLVGWSLRRQHAPWALALGPLSNLQWLPRIRIDGFVVAPASWRTPPAIASGTSSAAALRAWRKDAGVPRFVQVGHEDELLPVDLEGPTARADLRGAERVFEIWPPVDQTVDSSGRRVEAVIALALARAPGETGGDAHGYQQELAAAAIGATAAAAAVPPPRQAHGDDDVSPPAHRWRTFKVFGAADRQDRVLFEVIAPAVAAAQKARLIEGWFFQRYIDGPGRRPHLRVRVAGNAEAFARRLETASREARAAGDVVAIETAPYFPETARLGGAASLPGVHALFEASSDLVVALLGGAIERFDPATTTGGAASSDLEAATIVCLVATFDRLGQAFCLDLAARRSWAGRRREAHAADVGPELDRQLARELRALRPALRAALAPRLGGPDGAGGGDAGDAALDRYERTARRAASHIAPATRARILPALLHLDAVRMLGPDPLGEIRAYTFWERTLESLAHHPARGA